MDYLRTNNLKLKTTAKYCLTFRFNSTAATIFLCLHESVKGGTTPRNMYLDWTQVTFYIKKKLNWFLTDFTLLIHPNLKRLVSFFIRFEGVVRLFFFAKIVAEGMGVRSASFSTISQSRSFLDRLFLGGLALNTCNYIASYLQFRLFLTLKIRNLNTEEKRREQKPGSREKGGSRCDYKISPLSRHSSLGRHLSVSIQVTIMQSFVS